MKRLLDSIFPIGRDAGRMSVSSRQTPALDTALLGLLLLGGCGTTATSSPTTYHDYQLQLSQIGCEARYRCCGTQCTNTVDQTFNLSMVSTQKLIDAGKIRFDAAAAATCLDSQRSRSASCDLELLNQPSISPMCAQILVGTIEVNQPCNTAAAAGCVANAYCDATTATCRTYLADGAACGTGGRCKTTSYCDTTAMVCKPLPRAGEACSALVTCDSTGERLVCAPDMKCSTPLGDGATCTSSTQCKSGTCSTGTTRVCTPATTPPQTVRDSLCRAT